MHTIKSIPGLTFVVLNFFVFCSLNVVFVLVKSGFCYLSCEIQKIYHKGFCYAKNFASLFRLINANISVNNSQNGSTGHTGSGHFIHTVRHVHILNHGHFTGIVSALEI